MNEQSQLTDLSHKFSVAAEIFARSRSTADLNQLRLLRVLIVRALLSADTASVEAALPVSLSGMIAACLKSGMRSFPRIEMEDSLLAACRSQDFAATKSATSGLGALLLSWHACELGDVPDFDKIPAAVRPAWLAFLFETPPAFNNEGDAECYVACLQTLCRKVADSLIKSKSAPDLIQAFNNSIIFTQSYFTELNLHELMRTRATVIERILESNGAVLDQMQVMAPQRSRPRIGFICQGLNDGTETVFLAAHLERLDRQRYDVRLYSRFVPHGAVGELCRASAEGYLQLPETVNEAVTRLRREDLDIAIFCTNLTAVNGWLTQIAAHRVARVMASSIASPVTTGLRNMDVMISGSANEPAGAEAHYVERLVCLDGALNCYPFQYMLANQTATVDVTRGKLGIPEDAVLYCSAANYYKILPELSAQWIDILRRVKGSRLMLLPFNPNWSSSYPREPFLARLQRQLRDANLPADSIHVIEAQPTIADLHRVLGIADIYLDAYPFSGACSIYDPLAVGLPVVARGGPVCRSRHSVAMLEEAGLADWISADVAAYIERAVALGMDPALRRAESERLSALRADGFSFADTAKYAAKLTPVFDELIATWNARATALGSEAPENLARRITQLSMSVGRQIGEFSDRSMIVSVVLPYLRNNSSRRLLDVGAHFGVMTQPFLADGWQATLFEPDVRCHPYLNALLAHYPGQVRHEPAAVTADHDGISRFHLAAIPGLSGLSDSPFAADQSVVEVPCLALTPYIVRMGLGDVDFIKIDAEGHDFGILEGIDLARIKPRLMMVEFGEQFANQDRASVDALLARLRSKGYRACVFCFQPLGDFKLHQWQTRLLAIGVDAVPAAPAGEKLLGNILFFRDDDSQFLPSIAAWLEDISDDEPVREETPTVVRTESKVDKKMNRQQRRAVSKHGKVPVAPVKRINPQVESMFAVAVNQHQNGRMAEALAGYMEVLKHDPDHSAALNNLGLVHFEQGRLDEAEALYKKAAALDGKNANAFMNLGNLFKARGDNNQALAYFEKSLTVEGNHGITYVNMGNLLQHQGKVQQALVCYEKALQIDPKLADAHVNMGNTLSRLGRAEEAVKCFERALAIRPDYAAAYNNMGTSLLTMGKHDQAISCFQEAMRLKPNYLDAYLNIGNLYKDLGRGDEAAAYYEKILAIDPDHSGALSNIGFSLNYSDTVDAQTLARQHFRAGSRIERKYVPAVQNHANSREHQRKLRIGYVSPDFRYHAVICFFEPLLRSHDRSNVEIFCYAEVFSPDGMTTKLQGMADHWLSTVGMSDDDLAARIRSDKIDILVDLAGHSNNNRLAAFARRPAPVQVTWLGYPNTTGLTNIDYRFVDAVSDPPGVYDSLASETLVRLDGGFLCYAPFVEAPAPLPPPCLKSGEVVFGSFNNLPKLSPATLDAWSKLLMRVPKSKLVLKNRFLGEPGTRDLVMGRFADRKILAERVTLLAGIPDSTAHMAAYHDIDIGLDSFPYNGTTTTCEALWMGIPVVGLAGDRHLARVGASLLTHVGVPELIARDTDQYVDIAAALAADMPRLTAYHAQLRTRMQASSLCDPAAFARGVENAYRDMWHRWCEERESQKIPAAATIAAQ